MADVTYATAMGYVLVGMVRGERRGLRRHGSDDRKQNQDRVQDLAPQKHACSIIPKETWIGGARPNPPARAG